MERITIYSKRKSAGKRELNAGEGMKAWGGTARGVCEGKRGGEGRRDT